MNVPYENMILQELQHNTTAKLNMNGFSALRGVT